MRLLKTHKCGSKKLPNSPSKSFDKKIIGVMMNTSQIHEQIRIFEVFFKFDQIG